MLYEVLSPLVICTALLSSCQQEKMQTPPPSKPQPIIIHRDNLVAIDTFGCDARESKYYQLDTRITYYPIYYIGSNHDTAYLNRKRLAFNYSHNVKHYRYLRNEYLEGHELEIEVDTFQELCKEMLFDTYIEAADTFSTDSIITHQAWPIWIQNKSDSLISIGYVDNINFLTRQCLTRSGEWVDLDTFDNGWHCLANLDLYMKPKEIVLAKFIRFGYGAKGMQRLKFRHYPTTIYSNVFEDFLGEFSYWVE